MRIELTFSSQDARHTLAHLANGDLSRPMAAGAEILVDSVQQNFSDGGRYDRAGSILGGSNKWKVTNNPTPLIKMGMQGGLMHSITGRSDNDSAFVSSDKPYAAIHNFGGSQTSYARSEIFIRNRSTQGIAGHPNLKPYASGTKAGRGNTYKGGTRTVEARPFAVIQEEDIEDFKDRLRDYLTRPVR